jgi:hypothetical protein
MDVFQANDGEANFLFHNEGKGRFSEVALEAGVAYDPNGAPRGGMGVDAEDAFGTGRPDLFVANFSLETNAYFANAGEGSFRETTPTLGLGSISYLMSGFGAAFLDYDNDGRPDLFVLNGHPLDTVAQAYPTVSYAEPPFLFENNGRGFEEVAARRGEPLARAYAGRGLAVADYDNDGDPDLLLLNVGQSPVLCRNDGGSASHWLGVTLQGTRSNRDGIGARVTVVAGGRSQTRRALGGRSYLSACDRRLLFGLGGADRVDRLEVQWPSGARSELLGLRADRYVPVRE